MKKIIKKWGNMKKPAPKQISSEGNHNQPDQDFQQGSFFICVYQEGWYIGQNVQRGRTETVEGDQYLFVNFMCQCSANEDGSRWPKKMDVLNVLKEDILKLYLSHID